jgi:hypothetical protein
VKLRRDILLFGALAVVALGAGWWLLANRPGGAIEAFRAEAKARAEAAVRRPADANAFRATVCAERACVVVEAGGLTFVVGAGEGSAAGLASLGLLRPEIDAVLLGDLRAETLAGLPGLAVALAKAGRTSPLKVFGPSGVVPVIDGMNLVVSSETAIRLQVGQEGENEGLAGIKVFDSGVVTVRAFGKAERAMGRTYRFDFDGKSLVVAGCGSLAEDIVGASRGTAGVSAVLAASSDDLAPDAACLEIAALGEAVRQGGVGSALITPAYPPASAPGAIPAWKQVLARDGRTTLTVGAPGASMDLGGDKPVVREDR